MSKAFEKILERLEEPQFNIGCGSCSIKEKCDEVQEKINDEMTDLCAETMRAIAQEIVQEVAEEYKDGWIPCSEMLPEDGLPVLLQDSEGYYSLGVSETNRNIKGFRDGDWWGSANNYKAWQPLPEPFKESD